MDTSNNTTETMIHKPNSVREVVLEHQLKAQTKSALTGSIALEIIQKHLGKMLSEHEEYFNLHGKFESYEFGEEYIQAASAAAALGRKGDIIIHVQNWLDQLSAV